MRFRVGRVHTHADSDSDGGAVTQGSGDVTVPVWVQNGIWVGSALKSEGDGVVAVVQDTPEKNVQRGGAGEDVFAEEEVEMVIGAGEGGEML